MIKATIGLEKLPEETLLEYAIGSVEDGTGAFVFIRWPFTVYFYPKINIYWWAKKDKWNNLERSVVVSQDFEIPDTVMSVLLLK